VAKGNCPSQKRLDWLHSPFVCCGKLEIDRCRGDLAEACCRLAELERDWAVIDVELPKVILGHKQHLAFLRELRLARAIKDDDTEEQEVAEKLRAAQSRLERLKRKSQSP
jgi:hypothetical protein